MLKNQKEIRILQVNRTYQQNCIANMYESSKKLKGSLINTFDKTAMLNQNEEDQLHLLNQQIEDIIQHKQN